MLEKGEKMKLKIAIVGATGALGRQLVARFQESGRDVRALVRMPGLLEGLLSRDSEALPCDLLHTPGSLLAEYLKGCDAVIHAATQEPLHPRDGRDWEPANRLRMEGTSRLIEAALRAGVGFYLQQGTVSAYVDGGEHWLDEETPFDILPARAVMTLAVADMERRVREIPSRVMNWAILRIGRLRGPGTPEEGLARELEEGKAVVPGSGSHFISPVHVADAASAFVGAVRRRPRQKTLNIVDEPIRYGDYLDLLAGRLGLPRPPRDLSQAKHLSHRCSNGAAREELNWTPLWGLQPDKRLAVGA
jgi:nucleoside-diphosphate-sugar epimerase